MNYTHIQQNHFHFALSFRFIHINFISSQLHSLRSLRFLSILFLFIPLHSVSTWVVIRYAHSVIWNWEVIPLHWNLIRYAHSFHVVPFSTLSTLLTSIIQSIQLIHIASIQLRSLRSLRFIPALFIRLISLTLSVLLHRSCRSLLPFHSIDSHPSYHFHFYSIQSLRSFLSYSFQFYSVCSSLSCHSSRSVVVRKSPRFARRLPSLFFTRVCCVVWGFDFVFTMIPRLLLFFLCIGWGLERT